MYEYHWSCLIMGIENMFLNGNGKIPLYDYTFTWIDYSSGDTPEEYADKTIGNLLRVDMVIKARESKYVNYTINWRILTIWKYDIRLQ